MTDDHDKITVENVNVPGYTTRVNAAMYNAMKKAMWKVLPKRAPGMTQAEMREAVLAHLPEDLFPGGPKPDGGPRRSNSIWKQKGVWFGRRQNRCDGTASSRLCETCRLIRSLSSTSPMDHSDPPHAGIQAKWSTGCLALGHMTDDSRHAD